MVSKDVITDPELIELARKISADTGFDILQYKERPLKRRLAVRLRANQLLTYAQYLQKLKDDPAEYPKLLDALTINVTKFYRNPETYAAVSSKVLPRLDVQTERDSPVHIWSAGCSSGEEPYSLSILWQEYAAGREPARSCKVFATDIDKQSLEKAKLGLYDHNSMDEIPDYLISKYFKTGPGSFEVTAQVKRLVEFRYYDLFEPCPFQGLDLIFCRNVLIYFSRPAQEDIFDNFRNSLKPKGFLVLGKVETMFGRNKDHFSVFDAKERIYQLVV
jgi:chemotaxis protein methyltransferase CheR